MKQVAATLPIRRIANQQLLSKTSWNGLYVSDTRVCLWLGMRSAGRCGLAWMGWGVAGLGSEEGRVFVVA